MHRQLYTRSRANPPIDEDCRSKLSTEAELDARCVRFLEGKLNSFDTSELDYFRVYDRAGQTAHHGVWGRCRYPNRRQNLGYRIRCSISIPASALPHPIKSAIGSRQLGGGRWEWIWRKDHFSTKEEALVWIAGHEAFHWLRHSRQIPGRNYETQANRYGFLWLDEWRATMASGRPTEIHRQNSHSRQWPCVTTAVPIAKGDS